jgi:UDP-N-acetylglucosamine:LPS N-acetylglucosamine transferase
MPVSELLMAPTRVDLVYFNAGGGHRAAAQALLGELRLREPQWEVRLVDLFQVLDPEGWFQRLTGFAPETYYNKRLATGFTLGLAQELKVLQAMIRAADSQLVARLTRHWSRTAPDLVVSLVPNFNRAMARALKAHDPAVPFVTVMTDLADLPPNFWIEPGHTQHLVCGTDHAVQQALQQGLAPGQVHRVSGMILRPAFHEPPGFDRERIRQELGFAPGSAVGIVMFGGHGSAAMKRIAASLADQPLILLCGRNASLAQALTRQPARAPRHVVGFTEDVAHWLRLADYFIGKPGPGSLSEALHCGLPVIVARNAWTMPQERWNTDWIREQQVGIVLGAFTQIRAGVQQLLQDLPRLRGQVAQLRNEALFEVAGLLPRLLGPAAAGTPIDLSSGRNLTLV